MQLKTYTIEVKLEASSDNQIWRTKLGYRDNDALTHACKKLYIFCDDFKVLLR